MNRPNPAFSEPNVRLFIAFRVFFNARFYYPVFTILFLDFGLTIQQFALLNAVWAACIVCLEVPSGALADVWGRRNLLILAGSLMVVEIALLCFAPRTHPNLLFAIFIVNRVLSGTAEAAASGADEALAYDSLKAAGQDRHWPRVLEKMMRYQSLVYIFAMSLGAALYDPALMQTIADALHIDYRFTQDTTLRLPLYLTLIMALFTLVTTLHFKEPKAAKATAVSNPGISPIRSAFGMTFQAGGWILKTPFALMIIFSGLLFDHVIRMLITLNSQYYRLIHLPEASFGLIGSALALLGMFIPRLARRWAETNTPERNLIVLAVATLAGFIGVTFFWPWFGLLPVVLLYAVIMVVSFLVSHYLNRITTSGQRATVLSFKGLMFNLAYGGIGIVYALLVNALKSAPQSVDPGGSQALENMAFIQSIGYFPAYFAVAFSLLLLIGRHLLKSSHDHRQTE